MSIQNSLCKKLNFPIQKPSSKKCRVIIKASFSHTMTPACSISIWADQGSVVYSLFTFPFVPTRARSIWSRTSVNEIFSLTLPFFTSKYTSPLSTSASNTRGFTLFGILLFLIIIRCISFLRFFGLAFSIARCAKDSTPLWVYLSAGEEVPRCPADT